MRVRGLELTDRFQTLANPGAPLQPAVAALTGLRDAELRRAPPVAAGIRRFLEFAGDAVLVAHNARFDMAFLDNETMRLTGSRVAATVVDTVGARTAAARPAAREPRRARAPLRDRRPALPPSAARRRGDGRDPVRLIGMAQERGATDRRRPRRARRDAAAPQPRQAPARLRRAAATRRLPVPRRPRPGAVRRQGARPARAPALLLPLRAAAAGRRSRSRRAARESNGASPAPSSKRRSTELRLIRELRPPANARSARPDRYVYLRRRGDTVVCSASPGPLGPIKSRRAWRSSPHARCKASTGRRSTTRLPKLQQKLRRLARDQRFEDAARLRDRIAALEQVAGEIARLERLRSLAVCVVAPDGEAGAAWLLRREGPGRLRPALPRRPRCRVAGGPSRCRPRRAEPGAGGDRRAARRSPAFLRRPPPELEVVFLHSQAWTSSASVVPETAGGSSSQTA